MKRECSKHRILCLWLPNWPLQRLQFARPELKGRDVTLYRSERGALRVVASTRYQAGTPLAEVTTGHVEPHDAEGDRTALLELAAWCEQFSPTVGIEPPDNLCLEVAGVAPLFGGEESLATQIARACARRLTARLAVAGALGAAWALAHFGGARVVVSHGTGMLACLPVAALRLPGHAGMLAELGIETIGQLAAIPRDGLASRFDPHVLLRLDQALGLVPEVIASHRPPPEIVAETQLEHPAGDRPAIAWILNDLFERVARALAEHRQGALQIACELCCEGMPISFVVGMCRPTADAMRLLELAQLQLERLSLPGPVAAAALSVLSAAPLSVRQQELFDESHREDQRHVRLLIDRLSNRLGREAVVRALPQDEAQPELAFRYEPLTGATRQRIRPQRQKPLPRPLRLENEPIPLSVLSIVPDGPPVQFQWHGHHRVARAWGPERIQTGWWRGRYVQRDYYRVETSEGKRFWLFRRLHDGKWFLHGVFD